MLRITTKKELNDPYELAKICLHTSNIHANISHTGEIILDGDLSNEVYEAVLNLDNLERIDNFSEEFPIEAQDDKKIIRRNGGATYLKANSPRNFKEVDTKQVKIGQLWRVDLGDRVGSEMAYLHYVIPFKEIPKTAYRVLIFTSKYKNSDNIENVDKAFQVKFSEENLINPDKDFLEISKPSYALFEETRNIDISRFEKCVGTVKEELLSQIFKAYENYLKRGEIPNNITTNANVRKRAITKESLNLSEKQKDIFELASEGDILAIANNVSITYEKRARALFGIFNIPITGDGDYLLEFIKRLNYNNDVNRVYFDMTRKKSISPKGMENKLNVFIKKYFKSSDYIIPFANLINKLAN